MGGRGGASGLTSGKQRESLTSSEITNYVDSLIKSIRRQRNIYGDMSDATEEGYRAEFNDILKKGFSGLEEGRVLDINPKNQNMYIVKEGDHAVMYKYSPTHKQRYVNIISGTVKGEKGVRQKVIELDKKGKQNFLLKSILIRKIPRYL